MGALDALIAAAPKPLVLSDEWHRKIAAARAVGVTWSEIARAIAEDTGTERLGDATLRDRHAKWRRSQG